jgi:hypothetical protein
MPLSWRHLYGSSLLGGGSLHDFALVGCESRFLFQLQFLLLYLLLRIDDLRPDVVVLLSLLRFELLGREPIPQLDPLTLRLLAGLPTFDPIAVEFGLAVLDLVVLQQAGDVVHGVVLLPIEALLLGVHLAHNGGGDFATVAFTVLDLAVL